MLQIREVKYELENKGPGNGHPELSIYFDDVDELDARDKPLFEQFTDDLAKLGIEANDAYQRACDGTQETFFKFNGSDIIKDENFEDLEEFMNTISKDSLETQKRLQEQGALKLKDFRPPYFLWEGKPEVITNKSAYELFNIPYAVINNEDKINQLALVQVMNHTYGKVYVDWLGNGKDAEFIENMRDTFKFFKVTVISKPEFRKEVKEFCMKNGYVNYTYMED